MKTKILLTLVLISGLYILSASAAPPASDDMTQTLETIREKYNLPALAVVVVTNGAICDRIAVGVRKWDDPTPVTTNDVFHIGSDTKAMTATLAAMLIDDGQLNWDTTIADVFPEFRGRINSQYEDVTVEQLLTHRSGLSESSPAAAWRQRGTPAQQRYEFIQAVLAQPPAAAPGTQFIYSNQNYAIIGAMLERITGTPWETLITERLFQPLHMDSAGFGPPGTLGEVDQPWGHTLKDGVPVPTQSDNPPAIAPAARVHCSLDDLARFTIFQMSGASNGLLKPETLARLQTPPAGSNYACGWLCVQRPWAGGTALTHAGSNKMWYVVMWLAPKKNFSVVVGTNIAGLDAQHACDDAVMAVIHHWLGK
jgi:CubicO group peptidase (beta-lactamase class C family)